jgi:hypothetical protein
MIPTERNDPRVILPVQPLLHVELLHLLLGRDGVVQHGAVRRVDLFDRCGSVERVDGDVAAVELAGLAGFAGGYSMIP